jgi:spermidine synthase
MSFVEKQSWGETHYDVLPGSHVSFRTSRQHVDLITNPRFGRMLFLDNVLQSSSVDEHIYHETLVSFGINPESRNILIAGGGEGAVVRELIKEKSVKKIVMIDWDSELVEHLCKSECMNNDVFLDPRVYLIHEDIVEYLSQVSHRGDLLVSHRGHLSATNNNIHFDTVFLDLLDIHTEEEYQFTRSILRSLGSQKTVVLNVGSSREMAERFGGEIRELFVPSFQEPWYLVKLTL